MHIKYMLMYAYINDAHTCYTRIHIIHTHNVCIHCKEIPDAYNPLIKKERENTCTTQYTIYALCTTQIHYTHSHVTHI